jgi:hypothetical protein
VKNSLRLLYFGLFPQPFLPPQLFLSLLAGLELRVFEPEFLEELLWVLLCCWSLLLLCCACTAVIPAIKPERHAVVIRDLKLGFI